MIGFDSVPLGKQIDDSVINLSIIFGFLTTAVMYFLDGSQHHQGTNVKSHKPKSTQSFSLSIVK